MGEGGGGGGGTGGEVGVHERVRDVGGERVRARVGAREARGVRESEGREDAYEEEEEEEEEEEAYEEEEEASTSEDEERDAKRTSERAEAAPLAAAMTATTTIATEPEPEPERDVDRQNTAATVVSSVAVAPAAKSVVAVSAKFVAALAVGATAVVAPFVMGGSSNSLAPGPTSSLSSRLRDVNFFNSRGRSLNSYEGPNWRAMERAEATAAANVAPLQQRLAEMEEELRQANDELERARRRWTTRQRHDVNSRRRRRRRARRARAKPPLWRIGTRCGRRFEDNSPTPPRLERRSRRRVCPWRPTWNKRRRRSMKR